MPLTSGTPRWQKFATFVILLSILGVVFVIYDRVGTTNEAVQATNNSSERRDCVTTLSAARNAVFTDVQINTAVATQILNTALLRGTTGATPLGLEEQAALVKEYGENNSKLSEALVEARRLQPATVLDDLIKNGGTINGVEYPACPE